MAQFLECLFVCSFNRLSVKRYEHSNSKSSVFQALLASLVVKKWWPLERIETRVMKFCMGLSMTNTYPRKNEGSIQEQ